MRIIVCGSRDWDDAQLLFARLGELVGLDDTLIHGAARGADRHAGVYADLQGIACEAFPAEWDKLGKSAGFKRNEQMLASGADLVVAFSTRRPATPGTAHMCRLAYEAGVRVVFVTPDGAQTTHQLHPEALVSVSVPSGRKVFAPSHIRDQLEGR